MDDLIIEKVRRETPGCKHVIHLNNAGAALMPSMVVWAIKKYIDLEAKIGGYEAAALKESELFEFYILAAKLINTQPHQIAFTANATDAYSRALSSIPFKKGDVILTTRHDYISNQIAFLSFRKRFGIEVHFMPTDDMGLPDLDLSAIQMESLAPALVSVTHIPTNCGTVQSVEQIGQLCRKFNLTYLVDACQSIGQRTIDVQKIGCDFLSVTARKFLRGPRGAGFLFVSQRALDMQLEPLLIDMRGAKWTGENSYQLFDGARRFEDWEFPYALMQGSKEAIRYALNLGMDRIASRTKMLAARIRNACEEMNHVHPMDYGSELSGIVTLDVDNWKAAELKSYFHEKNINTSIVDKGSALLDFEEKGIDGALRVSPHYYNSNEEITLFIRSLEELQRSE